jgi:hypothetical protein
LTAFAALLSVLSLAAALGASALSTLHNDCVLGHILEPMHALFFLLAYSNSIGDFIVIIPQMCMLFNWIAQFLSFIFEL